MRTPLSFPQSFNQSFLKMFALLAFMIVCQGSLTANTLLVATGPGPGHPPIVRVTVDTGSGNDTINIQAYPNSFTGGVRVAVGDVNGDGIADIVTGPGPGMAAHIRVFNGSNGQRLRGRVGDFLAFPTFFSGGVFVAAGDVNGDGRADIVVAPDRGGLPLVRVFDGRNGNQIRAFFAYSPVFTGGVRVAVGDVNGDNIRDIVTGAGPGAGPHVKAFSGGNLDLLRSFFAYEAGFLGGVYVAAGDVNGDGVAEIVTGAGPGGGPHVKVFNGVNLNLHFSFFAFEPSFTGGVRVAAGDVNNDGLNDIITGAGPGGGPHVKVFNATNLELLHSFFAYDPAFAGGVFVAGAVGRRRQGD